MHDFMAPADGLAPARGSRPAVGDEGASRRFLALMALAAAALAAVALVATTVLGPRQAPGIGKDPFTLFPIQGLRSPSGFPVAGLSDSSLRGEVTVVNVWASWCPYCKGEHETLLDLARSRKVRLVGLVSQDTEGNAARYLREQGNPYAAVSVDTVGLARRLGTRGVPATVVLDRQGQVVASLRGALDEERVRSVLLPAVDKARSGR